MDTREVPEWLPVSLVFWPNYRFDISDKRLFLKEIMAPYTEPFVHVVSVLDQADFVAVPFDYFFVEQYAPDYLTKVYALAEGAGKKVLLFDYSDYVDRTPQLPVHAVLFRVSVYRHHRQKNEIVMPYFVEDLGSRYAIGPKKKENTLVVGYCGQTRFGSRFKKLKAIIKRAVQSLILYARRDVNPRAHERGIFWRARAIRFLSKSGIESRIIERSFYSMHRSGVSRDPKDLRREYVENLRECDLALCVRGDANASQRFYEALSASRVPLFLDTDCVLPLEEIIPYDDFILRIPSGDIAQISRHVRAWEGSHRPSTFEERENRVREIFEQYLRLDRYFSVVFDREKSPYTSILYGA